MADWIRRSFTSAGLTQIPPGPHLRALQDRFGGTVMLCIDVSGSMDGRPILEAVRGAREFVARGRRGALQGRASCSGTPDVVALAEPTAEGKAAMATARPDEERRRRHQPAPPARALPSDPGPVQGRATIGWSRSSATATSAPRELVLAKVAQMKAENIRFVTRGLGAVAAREFARGIVGGAAGAWRSAASTTSPRASPRWQPASSPTASRARGRFWHFQRIASGWLLALAVLPGAAVVILVPNRAT